MQSTESFSYKLSPPKSLNFLLSYHEKSTPARKSLLENLERDFCTSAGDLDTQKSISSSVLKILMLNEEEYMT